jgi:hypothetical protein
MTIKTDVVLENWNWFTRTKPSGAIEAAWVCGHLKGHPEFPEDPLLNNIRLNAPLDLKNRTFHFGGVLVRFGKLNLNVNPKLTEFIEQE